MKKKSFKFPASVSYDAPVTLTFAFLSIIIFLLNTFVIKQKLTFLIASPTTTNGQLPFVASNFLSYIRIFLYPFGSQLSSVMVTNLIFILLLGPNMEERYGSVIIGIMTVVSIIFAGVLTACFCKNSLTGASPIVFMLIFLNSFMSMSKKKIPLSFVFVFVLFILLEVSQKNPNAAIGIIINIAGGLCGSLFAFLTSPKTRNEKKNKGEGLKSKAERLAEFDDENSPRFKNKKSDDSSSDETVIGTLNF